MKRTEDRGLGRIGPALMALVVCLVMMLFAPAAQPAFGYTAKWNPVYHDYTLVGGTAIANMPTNMINAPVGYGLLCETLHVAVHTWCDTLELSSVMYDPVIYCLDNSIGVTIGIPQAVNSTTYTNYICADSTTLQLAGRWRSFILSCQATADSTGAHGYVVVGRSAPNVTSTRLY